MERTYTVIIEKSSTGYGAYTPEIDGVIATGQTIEEVVERMRGAMAQHLAILRDLGEELPEPGDVVAVQRVTVALPD